MSIPQSFLEEIRSRLSLSDMIGRRIKVTRAGREYKACCPFHHEKTPSFTINDDKQFYHCFGCGAHGDVLKFVMEHDGLPFLEAVEMLAAEAGLQMPEFDPKAKERADKAKDQYTLMDEAASWMQAQVSETSNKDVLAYLDGRGLDAKTRDLFRIGYTPHDGQALRKHLKGLGHNDKDMIEVGLLKQSTKGGEPYIFFRERVMFPVMDRRGRVVAFGGRILPDNLRTPSRGDFTPPKYINTADTPLFDKGRMLYGEWLARPAARDGHSLIVTEGYMDVIACYMAGFKGAVAPMGTALTDDQIATLWQIKGEGEKDPILCFDGDNAGRRAASRACDNLLPLLGAGRSARFAFMPEGEDPDSLVKANGRDALKKILASSLSLFDFMWASQTSGRKFDTPESRAGLTKALQDQVANIQNADVQRHYKELIRSRISESFFKPYDNKKKRTNAARGNERPRMKGRLKPRAPLLQKKVIGEKILLAAIINNPALYKDVEEEFGHMQMSLPIMDNLRQVCLVEMDNNPDIDFNGLRHILKSQGFEEEMHDILSESVYVHAAFCRPGSVDEVNSAEIVAKWRAIYASLNENNLDQEIKDGWKQALQDADESQEERLRDILQGKKAGNE